MTFSNSEIVNSVQGWTLPEVHYGREQYISFSAFDPLTGKMKRKKVMLGRMHIAHGRPTRDQRRRVTAIMKRLTEKLEEGWNPWIEAGSALEYTEVKEVMKRYGDYLERLVRDDDMREESLASYLSYRNVLREWMRDHRLIYIYQLTRETVGAFLDYVFIERNNTLQTRNNYLAWLKTFSRWLLQRCYLREDPTAGMQAVQRRSKKKNRSVLPDSALRQLHEWLEARNRHFLLACQLLHYLFVRPREMSFIRIGDIHVREQTLELHGETTKNREDAVVTLPVRVIRLMVELGVLEKPSTWYLFGDGFMPGPERKGEKQFRDYWTRVVRKELGWPEQYKFYSLKDTGITNMLRANKDVLSVRDQARHSSIMITDTYTPKDIQAANRELTHYEGEL